MHKHKRPLAQAKLNTSTPKLQITRISYELIENWKLCGRGPPNRYRRLVRGAIKITNSISSSSNSSNCSSNSRSSGS